MSFLGLNIYFYAWRAQKKKKKLRNPFAVIFFLYLMEQHHLEAYTTIIYQFIERIIQLFLKYNNYNIKCSSIYFMVSPTQLR